MSKQEIIQGDCLEIMKTMPDKIFDIVITSPPFNLGNNHHTGNKKHTPYNDQMDEEEYQNWQIKVLNELHRIVNDTGSLLYQHKNRIREGLQITPYQWLLKTDWLVKQELVWLNGSQNFDKIRFYPVTERVYWLSKSADTKLHNIINHNDLFRWSREGVNHDHTRAFPAIMVKELLACFPNSMSIFDPFMGSGTTLVAAKQLNRNATGIEISAEYCEIARKRLVETQVPIL